MVEAYYGSDGTNFKNRTAFLKIVFLCVFIVHCNINLQLVKLSNINKT